MIVHIQTWPRGVLSGDFRDFQRPLDAERRVIMPQSALMVSNKAIVSLGEPLCSQLHTVLGFQHGVLSLLVA